MGKNYSTDDHAPHFAESEVAALRIGVVTSRFNDLITSELKAGAMAELGRLGVLPERIVQLSVPGAVELPLAAQRALDRSNLDESLLNKAMFDRSDLDAVICLGCVIRGETPHFDYVCSSCAQGLIEVSLKYGKPVIFGVLTTENLEQARERCGGACGHKGISSARAAVEMSLLSVSAKP